MYKTNKFLQFFLCVYNSLCKEKLVWPTEIRQNFTETQEITKVACPRSLWADKQKFLLIMPDVLGKHPPSKTDEFSEKFQTAFDPPPLIFGKSYCGFFIRLYSLKNHTCGIFLKSPGYESIKNNDPCCQIQCLNFKFWGWLGPRLLVH